MQKELKNPPRFYVIEDDFALKTACEKAQDKTVVALDTEFVRIRSYYPKLGLIQLYDGEQVSLILPEKITDFSPFVNLLKNPQVTKVLHACSEDLEVFYHQFKQLPQPLMDTQIMANFLDFAASSGFAALVKHYFQLELDKGASRTDWLARPLSEKQLSYAAADVWYLLPLYRQMAAALAQTPWFTAAQQDCALLLEKAQEEKSPDTAYLNIPNSWKLNELELARLQLLAKWRQEEAVKRDLALNFVVKGENLWLAAKHNPKSTADLLDLDMHPNEVRHHGKKILQILHRANQMSDSEYPPLLEKLSDDPRYKSTLKALQKRLGEITPPDLKPEVVASNRSLERLMRWVWLKSEDPQKLPDLLKGWRQPIGQALCSLLKQQ